MKPLVWLDLCSGLGGASQPALDRGWRVIRVDIDRRFKPDIVADVRSLPLRPFRIDVLWASPPCQEFTKWRLPFIESRPVGWKPTLERMQAAVDLVMAVASAVKLLKPSWWIIENVMGACEWLSPKLGMVRAISGGHVLWGNLPGLIPQTKHHKWRLSPSPQRSALRAKIPYEIGEAICIAVERRYES